MGLYHAAKMFFYDEHKLKWCNLPNNDICVGCCAICCVGCLLLVAVMFIFLFHFFWAHLNYQATENISSLFVWEWQVTGKSIPLVSLTQNRSIRKHSRPHWQGTENSEVHVTQCKHFQSPNSIGGTVERFPLWLRLARHSVGCSVFVAAMPGLSSPFSLPDSVLLHPVIRRASLLSAVWKAFFLARAMCRVRRARDTGICHINSESSSNMNAATDRALRASMPSHFFGWRDTFHRRIFGLVSLWPGLWLFSLDAERISLSISKTLQRIKYTDQNVQIYKE